MVGWVLNPDLLVHPEFVEVRGQDLGTVVVPDGLGAGIYFLRAIAPSDFSPTGSIADESNGNLLYQIYDKVLACVLAVCSPDKPVSRSFVYFIAYPFMLMMRSVSKSPAKR